MTWKHLTYRTKLRWNSEALKRLNFPCHASWKANHLPYSTVLRIEICDPCHGMVWFEKFYSRHLSPHISFQYDSMTLKSTMPVSPWHHYDQVPHFLFILQQQHHSVCFRKQLINTGSGVSFDSFVASVGGWVLWCVTVPILEGNNSQSFWESWFGHSLISFSSETVVSDSTSSFLEIFGPSHLTHPSAFETTRCIDIDSI